MRRLRRIWIGFIYYMRWWVVSPRIYACLVALACFSLFVSNTYAQISADIGEPYNAFEPFIILCANDLAGYLVYIIILGMICDAPYTRPGQVYTILRLRRRGDWIGGQLVYTIVSVALALVFMLICTLLFFGWRGYFGNVWSQTYVHLSYDASRAGMIGGSAAMMQALTPFSAALQALALNILYAAFLALVMYLLNLKRRGALGFAVAVILHLSGKITQSIGLQGWAMRLIPYHNAALETHNFTGGFLNGSAFAVGFSVIYFSALILTLLAAIFIIMRKKDIELGDENAIHYARPPMGIRRAARVYRASAQHRRARHIRRVSVPPEHDVGHAELRRRV